MAVWALADLHLATAIPEKSMEFFGEPWLHYTEKIHANWTSLISAEDLVLIPGDISWAMHLEEAKADLDWIEQLPGTKVLLRGNHDYWWSSANKIQAILPPSIHLIHNNAFLWHDIVVAGSRLWDTPEYQFGSYVEYQENPKASSLSRGEERGIEAEKIFLRELGRLEMSLKAMEKIKASKKIAMTHYPPIGALLEPSRASTLLEKYGIDSCVFGHLHSIKRLSPFFGSKNGIQYQLTSADFLNFTPLKIL